MDKRDKYIGQYFGTWAIDERWFAARVENVGESEIAAHLAAAKAELSDAISSRTKYFDLYAESHAELERVKGERDETLARPSPSEWNGLKAERDTTIVKLWAGSGDSLAVDQKIVEFAA